MAEAKKTQEQIEVFVSGKVRQDLWREFRAALTLTGRDVTEGLEEAIKDWLMGRKRD